MESLALSGKFQDSYFSLRQLHGIIWVCLVTVLNSESSALFEFHVSPHLSSTNVICEDFGVSTKYPSSVPCRHSLKTHPSG